MMKSIRKAIKTESLDEEEKNWIKYFILLKIYLINPLKVLRQVDLHP